MICDRAVLDANCIRGPPQAELQALVTSGYRLSISIDGLREVWAKSIRSNQRDMLTARLGLPLPLMDEMAPVAFTGSALLGMVGTVPGEVAADGARFREQVMKGILASLSLVPGDCDR